MACSLSIHLGLTVSSLEDLNRATIEGGAEPGYLPIHRQRSRALWSVLLLDR